MQTPPYSDAALCRCRFMQMLSYTGDTLKEQSSEQIGLAPLKAAFIREMPFTIIDSDIKIIIQIMNML